MRQRLRELAFLNSAATIHFRVLPASGSAGAAAASAAGAPTNGASPPAPASGASAAAEPDQAGGGGWETLACPGGLRDYVAFLNKERQPMHQAIYLSKEVCLSLAAHLRSLQPCLFCDILRVTRYSVHQHG